jgi:aldehyde:ferredoxin oxidoreductase
MYGYTSKSLRVDLSLKKIEIIGTPSGLNEKFIGGRGFGVALLGKRILNEFDSPDMPLIFASGPLVGTIAPTSGRSSVISRSPLTGTVLDCSVGGKFGTELKKAGFDSIEIVGISDRWVLLTIENCKATIEDAEKLAGKNVEEVRKQIGSHRMPLSAAGEKGVKFASIVFDGHYLAGRGGLGAVMGAKRLKAIKVKGDAPVTVYSREELNDAREEIMRLLRSSQAVFGELGLSEFGTAALVDLIHARRMEPTDNFRATFYDAASSYSGYRLKSRY